MKKVLFLILTIALVISLRMNAQEYHLGQIVENPDGSRGVVFYLNEDGTDGWMVALHDVGLAVPWGLADNVEGLDHIAETNEYLTTCFSDIDGYSNTIKIREHYEGIGYSGFYAAKDIDFENGWYLPAAGQLKMLYVNAVFYESALQSVGEKMGLHPYWSSTVESDEKAWYVHFGSPYPENAWAWNAYLHVCSRTEITSPRGGTFAIRPVRNLDFSPLPFIGQLQAPAMICDSGPIELVSPNLQNSDSYGWQIAQDEMFTNPIAYIGQILDVTYDGWYLRIWATNEEGITYSNVVRVSVHESSTSYTEIVSCEPYAWNGQTYSETGIYQITLANQWGCDSIAILDLTVNHPDEYFIPYPIYACGSYEWADMTLIESGVYEQVFPNQFGCDSTVTMSLYINQDVEHQFMDLGCGEYDWNGTIYTESGVYQQVLPAANGCDSIVSLYLTVKELPPVTQIQGETQIYYTDNDIYTYSIDPVPGCFGYMWSIDNDWNIVSGADSNECKVDISFSGTATLIVRVYTECGFIERSLFINHDIRPSVTLYPNPTRSDFSLVLSGMKGKAIIEIHDYLGQLIDRFSIDTEMEGLLIPYSLRGKAAGIYLISVTNDFRVITKTLVKSDAVGTGLWY